MQDWMIAGLVLSLTTALPLAWKWQLGVLRASIVISAFAAVSALIVGSLRNAFALGDWIAAGGVWVLSVGATVALLAYRFYRDPERQAPDRDDVIVSPADGVVIYVRKSEGGMLPVSDKHGRRYPLSELTKTPFTSDDAVSIGISMNFADVHVNRSPVDGRVTFSRHFPGLFGSLRKPEMLFENERATTVIERDGLQVAVVQIASRLVRQISVFLREGEPVALSQRLGVIRFGSQVDVVLPARSDVRITAKVGERLRAGESIIAVLEKAPATPGLSRAESRGPFIARTAAIAQHRQTAPSSSESIAAVSVWFEASAGGAFPSGPSSPKGSGWRRRRATAAAVFRGRAVTRPSSWSTCMRWRRGISLPDGRSFRPTTRPPRSSRATTTSWRAAFA